MIIKIPKLGAKFLSLPLLEDINIEAAQWKTLNSFQSKSQDSVSFQAKHDVYAQRNIKYDFFSRWDSEINLCFSSKTQ